MKGWEILAHSVRLVFNNIEQALKISVVPYAISALAFLFLGLPSTRVMEVGDAQAILEAGAGIWLGQALYTLVSAIVMLWIAVAWHRYVLLGEFPKGWLPQFRSGLMGAYFMRGFTLCLLIFGIFMVLSLALSVLAYLMGSAGAYIAGLIIMAVATYVFYRLCAILPAAAVGRNMPFAEAWQATRGSHATIAVLVALVIIASILIQMPSTLGSGSSIFGILYSLIINWLSMLIGVSVLTTFYGHFIEHRPID